MGSSKSTQTKAREASAGERVGIDLGTTNTVVAVMRGPAPEILLTRASRTSMRSVVSVRKRKGKKGEAGTDERETIVGDVAFANQPMAPRDTIISIKRLMGRNFDDPEVQRVREWFAYTVERPADGGARGGVRVVMDGTQYSPVDISAMILRQIKEDAEYRLGRQVTHAVITTPAYFNQAQNAATRLAAQRAGLKVIKILDEPTAAAIAYGLSRVGDDTPKTILVYDMGGGTFDISVLLLSGNAFVTLNTEGDMWLGGDNMDQAIVEWAVQRIREEYEVDPTGNARFMVMLKQAAQKAKEELGAARTASIILAGALQDADGMPVDVDLELTRETYEELIEPLVDRSMALIDKALANAHLTDDDVEYVLMAGNATMTPLVQRKVEARFGAQRVMRKQHPKHCVAEGAAIVAKMLSGQLCVACGQHNEEGAERCSSCGGELEARDSGCPACGQINEPGTLRCVACGAPLTAVVVAKPCTRHYGIQLADDSFAVFVRKNDPVPTEQPVWQTFRTQNDHQRMLLLPVWGGENLEKASANELQGQVFASLPPGLVAGTEVRISLALTHDEIFKLEATLLDGTALKSWVFHDEGGAAIDRLARCDARMQSAGAVVVSKRDRERVEDRREAVIDALRRGELAQRELDELESMVNRLVPAGGDVPVHQQQPRDVEEKAANLIGYAGMVLQFFDWGMPAEQAYELNRLKARTEAALAAYRANRTPARERELAEATELLDRATDRDKFSEEVQILLAIIAATGALIEPHEPKTAERLGMLIAATVTAFKGGDTQRGRMGLGMLIQEFMKAMERVPKPVPGPDVEQQLCPKCGTTVEAGAWRCSKCGWILVLAGGHKSHTSGPISA